MIQIKGARHKICGAHILKSKMGNYFCPKCTAYIKAKDEKIEEKISFAEER